MGLVLLRSHRDSSISWPVHPPLLGVLHCTGPVRHQSHIPSTVHPVPRLVLRRPVLGSRESRCLPPPQLPSVIVSARVPALSFFFSGFPSSSSIFLGGCSSSPSSSFFLSSSAVHVEGSFPVQSSGPSSHLIPSSFIPGPSPVVILGVIFIYSPPISIGSAPISDAVPSQGSSSLLSRGPFSPGERLVRLVAPLLVRSSPPVLGYFSRQTGCSSRHFTSFTQYVNDLVKCHL